MKLFNIVNSRFARERERESSLNFASSLFKKSFTLIELSIVLLILSLLVGSLLVGRQIVDRAKIQRIIFEFDYYEKAFHQFYDTYRVVPGNLDYKTCIKHAEFSGCACRRSENPYCDDTNCVNMSREEWCRTHTFVNHSSHKKIVNSHTEIGRWNNMVELKKSGLIGKEQMPKWSIDTISEDISFPANPTLDSINDSHNAVSNYDKNIYIMFAGFFKYTTYPINDARYGFINANWELNVNTRRKEEFYNRRYTSALDGHNAIIFQAFKSQETVSRNIVIKKLIQADFSVLSSKISQQLDSKIDDGRPGTGKLLAYKDGKGSGSNSSEETLKNTCYDRNYSEVDLAIYNSNTDTKYGCGLIKIMEDV